MSRLPPIEKIVRSLAARSGNQCAFPDCTRPFIDSDNKRIGEICHIEAANPGGQRYNPDTNDEQRRSYENLLILCRDHHKETDDIEKYPVEVMVNMKNEHERKFEELKFSIDKFNLSEIVCEMDDYWREIDRINKNEHDFPDHAMEVNGDANFTTVVADAFQAVDGIENMFDSLHKSDSELLQDVESLLDKNGVDKTFFTNIPYYKNPFYNRNWEVHNLGVNNWLQKLRITLNHMQVKYLEEYLKTNGNDIVAKSQFKKAKKSLKKYAKHAAHAD